MPRFGQRDPVGGSTGALKRGYFDYVRESLLGEIIRN